ncbi:MAG: hypothetical protein QOG15_1466 [Solirubrobacteraceae bacterium]|nr:hypothetical protein [Solirubrobacteraceae bacterium]
MSRFTVTVTERAAGVDTASARCAPEAQAQRGAAFAQSVPGPTAAFAQSVGAPEAFAQSAGAPTARASCAPSETVSRAA